MKKEKVLFLDTVHPVLRERLEQLGYECADGYSLSYEAVKDAIAGYTGIVIRSRIPIDTDLINAAHKLRFIARSGAGMENIAYEHAEKKGILCINAPEGNRDAVGEHAIGMLLALFNHLPIALVETRKGIWDREGNRGIELMGKTVGIIGFGNTGSAFARKLSGFDCKVLAYDKYKSSFGNNTVEEANMEAIFEEADVLSLHIPLTDETHHLVNDAFIRQFRKPFYLINTSRGPVVHTEDLVAALKSDKIAGACLDVLEYESASFEMQKTVESQDDLRYLFTSKKVLTSPHVAGWTVESYYKLSAILADKIEAAFHA